MTVEEMEEETTTFANCKKCLIRYAQKSSIQFHNLSFLHPKCQSENSSTLESFLSLGCLFKNSKP